MKLDGARLGALASVALIGGAVAGVSYWQYAHVWLRKPPPVPPCIIRARNALRNAPLVSGTEPHDDAEGNTIYLTEAEDTAVRCLSPVAKELSVAFTTAFAEIEPERRALELLKVLRDRVPRDVAHDAQAAMAYVVADAAIDPLPKLPETKAASEELQLLNACRFSVRTPCPTRPPMPMRVWIAGVPSSLALLGLIGYGGAVGVRGLVELVKRRRDRGRRPERGERSEEPRARKPAA